MDRYIIDTFHLSDPVLEETLRSSAAAGLPSIQVSPPQGKFLHLLVRLLGAKRVLEIGTLGGYSATWMARALPPGGKLITLELEPRHAEVARKNLERAGVGKVVDVRVGRAVETLPTLGPEGPFDLVFIDADKEGYPDYFDWAVRLARPGSALVFDNIIREGAVLDPAHPDPRVRAVRLLNERMSSDPRVSATEVQTVGGKKWDGFALAVVQRPGP